MSRHEVDIAVIGGGAGGLTASGVCAAFGAKTVLIEREKLGGDCTWTGCVPSKTLLSIAHDLGRARALAGRGVDIGDVSVNFKQVMNSVRSVRSRIYEEADSPTVVESRGVEVMTGSARFLDDRSLAIRSEDDEGEEQFVRFRSCIIAAGSSPVVPPIPGLDEVGFHTNETLFELEEQPEHLLVLGAGPIGVEMAQAFARLGSKVTVVSLDPTILPRDEEALSRDVMRQLVADGVEFRFGETLQEVSGEPGKLVAAVGPPDRIADEIEANAILIAIGRQPNLIELELEKTGVKLDRTGLAVDAHCRTTRKHIFAVGDVTTSLQFTHMAEHMGKVAAVNAVTRMPVMKIEEKVIPWVTYTDPEIGHVGASRADLERSGENFDVIQLPYSRIDRAITEGMAKGTVLLYRQKKKILGASVVGIGAGEIISEFALAMKNDLGLDDMADTIHPYPTLSLGARRAADQYYLRTHKRWMSEWVRRIFRYKGEIPKYVGSGDVI
jgi:pyruvate/2-oxoglutarate dehydrogenase complex dihydrolipoamide dehydrogenase (E3) component